MREPGGEKPRSHKGNEIAYGNQQEKESGLTMTDFQFSFDRGKEGWKDDSGGKIDKEDQRQK